MGSSCRKVLTNKEIKRKARDSLKEKWDEIIIFSCVYFLVLKVFWLWFLLIKLGDLLSFIPEQKNFIISQGVDTKTIILVASVIQIFLGGILIYGLATYVLFFIREKYCDNKIVFGKMKKLKVFIKTCFININIIILKIIWANFILAIIIILALAIFTPCFIDMLSRRCLYDILEFNVLPADIQVMLIQNSIIMFALFLGIMIIYFIIIVKYNFAFFISIDKQEKNFLKCIKESKEILSEYRIKLLLLYFSFLGWILISIITFGMGFILLKIYIKTSLAVFYENIKKDEV